jgi:hypothetical protein
MFGHTLWCAVWSELEEAGAEESAWRRPLSNVNHLLPTTSLRRRFTCVLVFFSAYSKWNLRNSEKCKWMFFFCIPSSFHHTDVNSPFFVITYCRYMLHSSRFFWEFLSSLVLWLVRTYGKWKCWTAPSAQSRYTGWRMFLLAIYSISEMDCYLFCELITFKYIKFVLETNERDEENVFTETRRTNHLYSIFTG